MRSTRHSWWVVHGICALLALGALGWTTVAVLHLEAGEREALAEADHQASLRLALWRMDSRIGPYLAREASRPFYEYEPYFPQPLSYTRMLSKIDPGEVLSPSPLLTFDSHSAGAGYTRHVVKACAVARQSRDWFPPASRAQLKNAKYESKRDELTDANPVFRRGLIERLWEWGVAHSTGFA